VEYREAAHLLFESRYAVVFTGAGISTASGIPDFRSPESGLWTRVDPFKVASIIGFRRDPKAFYDWLYPLAQVTCEAQPNPAHYALATLESMGFLKTIITQNIDTLHTRAGTETIYEIHGHMREMTCIHCFNVYTARPIILQYLEDNKVPHCPQCGSVLKPNVILFGEQLPVEQIIGAKRAALNSDLFIVVGSSLEVAPASDLPRLAKRNGAKLVIINLQPTYADELADIVIHADAAVVLPRIVQQLERIIS